MFNKGLEERIRFLGDKIQRLEASLKNYPAIEQTYTINANNGYNGMFAKIKKQIHKFKEITVPLDKPPRYIKEKDEFGNEVYTLKNIERTVYSDGVGIDVRCDLFWSACSVHSHPSFHVRENGEEVAMTKDQAEEIFNFVKTFIGV